MTSGRLAPLLLVLVAPAQTANALPAAAYHVELIDQPGSTSTSVRGVDANGRVLAYWNYYSQLPIPFAEPDDSGHFLWEAGVYTPLTIPGLTGVGIHDMSMGSAMWGRSDQGSFVYRGGGLDILENPAVDVTLVQGVDGGGRAYGLFGQYPEGTDPSDPIVPIEPISSFVWDDGVFADVTLPFEGAFIHGVRQDGVLWGSDATASFILDGDNLMIVDHPDYDYTGILGLTADGEVYGFALTISGGSSESTRFFWDPLSGFQNLPPDWTLPGTSLRPSAMNEAGVFWGYSGGSGSFVATPLPEPPLVLLVALSLPACGAARRALELSGRRAGRSSGRDVLY